MDRESVRRMLEPYPEDRRYEMLIGLFVDQNAHLTNERRRKAAPEKIEFDKLRAEMERAQQSEKFWQDCTETWKRVSQRIGEENAQLKKGTRIPRLEAEVEHWKHLWRNCTRRLGNAIEHLGMDHTGTEPNMDEAA